MKISTILDQIDLGAMALPEFRRGYMWYRKHPVGSLLVWVTRIFSGDSWPSPRWKGKRSVSIFSILVRLA
jgi:hypothetical protein